jgi:N-acetylmuramoyl-L-alanine amidase
MKPRGARPWVKLAALLLACGENAKPPDEPQLAALSIGEPELYAYRAAELERLFGETEHASADPLQKARALTRISRVHARIEGTCELCARAQPLLELALSRAPANDACDVGLDFLRVLTRDGSDATRAEAFARKLQRRFESQATTVDCTAATRELVAELDRRKPFAVDAAAIVSPPRAQDVAMSGDEAARFASNARDGATSVAQLSSLERVGGPSDEAHSEVRIVLGFDAPAQFRRGELDAHAGNARRVVLDFERTRPASGLARMVHIDGGGVMRALVSVPEPAVTRVEFEVSDAAQYRLYFLPSPYRVVLDFTTASAPTPEASSVRTIVLDPGHGGVHSGARGPNGLSEAEVALDLALRVRRVLARTLPDPRVVLTRELDRVVSLEERTAIANALGADLFVSIHLNASATSQDRGGVSTYVLDATHDAQALGLAARENDAAPADVTALTPLFGSLVRRDQVGRSLELAQVVHQATLRNGRRQLPNLADRGVKRALFYVLVGARMPAILCEASFLTRPEEAAALEKDSYRQLLAEGIAVGIARYVRKLERARTVLAEQTNADPR